MSKLITQNVLKENTSGSMYKLTLAVFSIIGIALFPISILSLFSVYYGYGIAVMVLYGLVLFSYRNRSFVKKLAKFHQNDTEPLSVGQETTISPDTPVYIGGEEETNIIDKEHRRIEPGEEVTLTAQTLQEIKVEGAVDDTIQTEGGLVIKIEEQDSQADDKSALRHLMFILKNDEEESDETEPSDISSAVDSAVSPVVGVILMLATTVVVAALILVALTLGLVYALGGDLQVTQQYLVPLVATAIVGSVVFPKISEYVLENVFRYDQVEVKQQKYVDDDLEEPAEVITVDTAWFITPSPHIVAPNDSKPQNWNRVSTVGDHETVHFFTDLEDESSVDLDGKVLYPNKEESDYNAMYESLESITIYDEEYNEIETLDIPEF